MPRRSDEAFVLVRYPFRERDLVVAVLTRSSGLVRVLARRARGPRSPFAGMLEPLALLRITFFERRRSELGTLDEVALVRSAFPLSSRPVAWAAGQVLAELALTFSPPGQRVEASFRLLDRCVVALLAGRDPRMVVDYASLWTVRLAGVLPDLDHCGACGRELPPGDLVYDRSGQTFVCSDHPAPGGRLAVSGRARLWLSAALASPVEAVEGMAPADARAWVGHVRRAFSEKELVSLRAFHALGRTQPGDRIEK